MSTAIDGVRRQAMLDAVNSLSAALKASLRPVVGGAVLFAGLLPCRCASCSLPVYTVCYAPSLPFRWLTMLRVYSAVSVPPSGVRLVPYGHGSPPRGT